MSVLDVLWKVMVATEAGTDKETVKETCWVAPGARLKLEGDEVTPVGNPATKTLTDSVNPLTAEMETRTIWLAPLASILSVAGGGGDRVVGGGRGAAWRGTTRTAPSASGKP